MASACYHRLREMPAIVRARLSVASAVGSAATSRDKHDAYILSVRFRPDVDKQKFFRSDR